MIPAVWTAMFMEQPLHDAYRTLHTLGWKAFEISTEHLDEIEAAPDPQRPIDQALACLDELGLTAPQAHAHLSSDVASPDADRRRTDIDRLRRHIVLSAKLGARAVVIHPGGRTQEDRREVLRLNAEAFRELGDAAGEAGVMIGIENLMWPGASTPAEMLEIIDVIAHPAIGMTLDTSHANVVGLNIPDAIRQWAPHLVATHISDNNGSGDQHLTPGGGTIDWPAVMAAFGEIPYSALFNLEIPGERHKVTALRKLKTRHAANVTDWLLSLAR